MAMLVQQNHKIYTVSEKIHLSQLQKEVRRSRSMEKVLYMERLLWKKPLITARRISSSLSY